MIIRLIKMITVIENRDHYIRRKRDAERERGKKFRARLFDSRGRNLDELERDPRGERRKLSKDCSHSCSLQAYECWEIGQVTQALL